MSAAALAVQRHEPAVFPAPEPLLPKENPGGEPEPRTAAASRMRLKHGLDSKFAVIPGESLQEFRGFRRDMILELLPGDPVECALVDQMVLAQWKLKRLWAAQAGVYLRHDTGSSYEASRSYPERVAQCVHDDNFRDRDLPRLSLEEVRLVNIFHKALRQYELRQDLRRKRLTRGAARGELEMEEYCPTPGPAPSLERRILPPASDSDDRRSSDIVDRGTPDPSPVQSAEPSRECLTRAQPVSVNQEWSPRPDPAGASDPAAVNPAPHRDGDPISCESNDGEAGESADGGPAVPHSPCRRRTQADGEAVETDEDLASFARERQEMERLEAEDRRILAALDWKIALR